jgi:hypothetical protein
MPPEYNEAPAVVLPDQDRGELKIVCGNQVLSKRSARRQRLSAHLHAAGPRPVLEALISVSEGRPLDDVLEDFGRIPADIYHAVRANVFPKPFLIDCGAST